MPTPVILGIIEQTLQETPKMIQKQSKSFQVKITLMPNLNCEGYRYVIDWRGETKEFEALKVQVNVKPSLTVFTP